VASISICFKGNLARRAGISQTTIEVPAEFSGAMDQIQQTVEAKIGKDVLHSILINGTSLVMMGSKRPDIQNGDEITIVPVILGG
jgi:molybdopterin converting factor small subunit